MAALLSLFGTIRVWWPIISMILSLLSGIHAATNHAKAADGSMTVADQATHVIGAGALSAALMVAGATGVVANHKAAAAAPSVAPAGVSNVMHQLQIAYTTMANDPNTINSDLDALNNIIKDFRPPAPKPITYIEPQRRSQ